MHTIAPCVMRTAPADGQTFSLRAFNSINKFTRPAPSTSTPRPDTVIFPRTHSIQFNRRGASHAEAQLMKRKRSHRGEGARRAPASPTIDPNNHCDSERLRAANPVQTQWDSEENHKRGKDAESCQLVAREKKIETFTGEGDRRIFTIGGCLNVSR